MHHPIGTSQPPWETGIVIPVLLREIQRLPESCSLHKSQKVAERAWKSVPSHCTTSVLILCILLLAIVLFTLNSSTQQSANWYLPSLLLVWLLLCSAGANFRALLPHQKWHKQEREGSKIRYLLPEIGIYTSHRWNRIGVSYWMSDGSKWIAQNEYSRTTY